MASNSFKHLLSRFQQRGTRAHTLLGFGHHHFAQIRPESDIVKARESNDLPASQRDQGEPASRLERLGDGCVPPRLLPDTGGGLKQALDFLRISHFRGAYQQSCMFLTHANSLDPRPGSADSVQRRLETPFPCATPSTQPPCQQADSSDLTPAPTVDTAKEANEIAGHVAQLTPHSHANEEPGTGPNATIAATIVAWIVA